MSWITLEIPPGTVANGTDRGAEGRWRTAPLCRWSEQRIGQASKWVLAPIKGWVQRTTVAMTGKCRALLAWKEATSIRWIAAGTESHLYAFSQTSTTPSDITPVGFVTSAADATAGAGYGVGLYGAGTYGTPRVDTVSVIEASVWTLDVWTNDDLLACMAEDGKIYRWQLDTGTPAAALGGSAPTSNNGIVVTPEGFLVAFYGRTVQWADQNSLSDWSPTATNQAGDNVLLTNGAIKRGVRLRAQTLLLTDVDVHAMNYIGLPNVYRVECVGENCGIISRGAVAVAGPSAYWMSLNGFYVYDGAVREIPCDIAESVFGDLNVTQRSKISAQLLSDQNEVWFMFPSAASTENDMVAVYNIAEGYWNLHPLSRLSGVDRGIFANPIMADADGDLFDHETGYLYGGETPSALSGPYELGDGEYIMGVREMVKDEGTTGDAQVSFICRDDPNAASVTYGPFTNDNFVNVHFAARQTQLLVEFPEARLSRWGSPRADVVKKGRR